MSELKADNTFVFGEECLAYKKSEADKVIAEKDAKILALDAEVFKQRHHAKLFFDERNYAETQLLRQKYKRCLAMAGWCKAMYDEEDARINGCGASWEYISLKMKYWERWSWYWESLAEEPTWAKFLQLIHKEAK